MKEVFSTGSFIQLRLPDSTEPHTKLVPTSDSKLPTSNSWTVPSSKGNNIVNIGFQSNTTGRYIGYVHVHTNWDDLVVPVSVTVVRGGIQIDPPAIEFGNLVINGSLSPWHDALGPFSCLLDDHPEEAVMFDSLHFLQQWAESVGNSEIERQQVIEHLSAKMTKMTQSAYRKRIVISRVQEYSDIEFSRNLLRLPSQITTYKRSQATFPDAAAEGISSPSTRPISLKNFGTFSVQVESATANSTYQAGKFDILHKIVPSGGEPVNAIEASLVLPIQLDHNRRLRSEEELTWKSHSHAELHGSQSFKTNDTNPVFARFRIPYSASFYKGFLAYAKLSTSWPLPVDEGVIKKIVVTEGIWGDGALSKYNSWVAKIDPSLEISVKINVIPLRNLFYNSLNITRIWFKDPRFSAIGNPLGSLIDAQQDISSIQVGMLIMSGRKAAKSNSLVELEGTVRALMKNFETGQARCQTLRRILQLAMHMLDFLTEASGNSCRENLFEVLAYSGKPIIASEALHYWEKQSFLCFDKNRNDVQTSRKSKRDLFSSIREYGLQSNDTSAKCENYDALHLTLRLKCAAIILLESPLDLGSKHSQESDRSTGYQPNNTLSRLLSLTYSLLAVRPPPSMVTHVSTETTDQFERPQGEQFETIMKISTNLTEFVIPLVVSWGIPEPHGKLIVTDDLKTRPHKTGKLDLSSFYHSPHGEGTGSNPTFSSQQLPSADQILPPAKVYHLKAGTIISSSEQVTLQFALRSDSFTPFVIYSQSIRQSLKDAAMFLIKAPINDEDDINEPVEIVMEYGTVLDLKIHIDLLSSPNVFSDFMQPVSKHFQSVLIQEFAYLITSHGRLQIDLSWDLVEQPLYLSFSNITCYDMEGGSNSSVYTVSSDSPEFVIPGQHPFTRHRPLTTGVVSPKFNCSVALHGENVINESITVDQVGVGSSILNSTGRTTIPPLGSSNLLLVTLARAVECTSTVSTEEHDPIINCAARFWRGLDEHFQQISVFQFDFFVHQTTGHVSTVKLQVPLSDTTIVDTPNYAIEENDVGKHPLGSYSVFVKISNPSAYSVPVIVNVVQTALPTQHQHWIDISVDRYTGNSDHNESLLVLVPTPIDHQFLPFSQCNEAFPPSTLLRVHESCKVFAGTIFLGENSSEELWVRVWSPISGTTVLRATLETQTSEISLRTETVRSFYQNFQFDEPPSHRSKATFNLQDITLWDSDAYRDCACIVGLLLVRVEPQQPVVTTNLGMLESDSYRYNVLHRINSKTYVSSAIEKCAVTSEIPSLEQLGTSEIGIFVDLSSGCHSIPTFKIAVELLSGESITTEVEVSSSKNFQQHCLDIQSALLRDRVIGAISFLSVACIALAYKYFPLKALKTTSTRFKKFATQFTNNPLDDAKVKECHLVRRVYVGTQVPSLVGTRLVLSDRILTLIENENLATSRQDIESILSQAGIRIEYLRQNWPLSAASTVIAESVFPSESVQELFWDTDVTHTNHSTNTKRALLEDTCRDRNLSVLERAKQNVIKAEQDSKKREYQDKTPRSTNKTLADISASQPADCLFDTTGGTTTEAVSTAWKLEETCREQNGDYFSVPPSFSVFQGLEANFTSYKAGNFQEPFQPTNNAIDTTSSLFSPSSELDTYASPLFPTDSFEIRKWIERHEDGIRDNGE